MVMRPLMVCGLLGACASLGEVQEHWVVEVAGDGTPGDAQQLATQVTSVLDRSSSCDLDTTLDWVMRIEDERAVLVGTGTGGNECLSGALRRTRYIGQRAISASVVARRVPLR